MRPSWSLRLRPADGEVGPLEHRWQQIRAEAWAFHRQHVTVPDHRHGGDELLVPAGVEGAHALLDQRVRLAERGMNAGDEADRADTVVRREGAMIGIGHGSDL